MNPPSWNTKSESSPLRTIPERIFHHGCISREFNSLSIPVGPDLVLGNTTRNWIQYWCLATIGQFKAQILDLFISGEWHNILFQCDVVIIDLRLLNNIFECFWVLSIYFFRLCTTAEFCFEGWRRKVDCCCARWKTGLSVSLKWKKVLMWITVIIFWELFFLDLFLLIHEISVGEQWGTVVCVTHT